MQKRDPVLSPEHFPVIYDERRRAKDRFCNGFIRNGSQLVLDLGLLCARYQRRAVKAGPIQQIHHDGRLCEIQVIRESASQ